MEKHPYVIMARERIKNLPETAGIYIIYSYWLQEIYVGSTANFRDRARKHYSKLIHNNHPNRRLQKTFNKKQILFFKVIRACSLSSLTRMEQQYMDRYSDKLLNATKIAAYHRRKKCGKTS